MVGLLLSFLIHSSVWASDSRLNKCVLKEEGVGNRVRLICDKKRPPFKWDGSKWHPSERVLKARIGAVSGVEFNIIAENRCAKGISLGKAVYSKDELLKRLSLKQQDLCSCVKAGLHLNPVEKCIRTPVQFEDCTVYYPAVSGMGILASQKNSNHILRMPTLADYQICLEKRINYTPPQNCSQASCADSKPDCRTGDELVNIADQGSCCPVFVCRNRGLS